MRDQDLRDQLHDSARALLSLPAPGLGPLRRRVRRRRTRIGAATLAASVAFGATIASVLPWPLPTTLGHPDDGHPAATPGWRPAGPPLAADASVTAAPYFVTLDDAFTSATMNLQPAAALVVDAFTGKVLAAVTPPAGAGNFTSAAAAGDDRTFFLSASSAFYELRLAADGKPVSLTRVYTAPAAGGLYSFAVSADATRLAYVTPHGIEVVSLPAGTSRLEPAPGLEIQGLTWVGDRMLAMVLRNGSTTTSQRALFRMFDVAAGPPPVPASSQLAAEGDVDDSLIAPDASAVFATVVTGAGQGNPMAAVEEFSTRTGRLIARLTPWTGESGMGTSCLPLWTDSSGTHGVIECGGAFTFASGHVSRSSLHLPGGNASTPVGAW
jgi:hypothetical protein